jgi:hypothetical protein
MSRSRAAVAAGERRGELGHFSASGVEASIAERGRWISAMVANRQECNRDERHQKADHFECSERTPYPKRHPSDAPDGSRLRYGTARHYRARRSRQAKRTGARDARLRARIVLDTSVLRGSPRL